MIRAAIFISLLLLATAGKADARNCEVSPVKDEPTSVYIRYTNQSYDSFQRAVDAVLQYAQIRHDFLGGFVQVVESGIQGEVIDYFQQYHIEVLKVVLAYYGKLHNSKVEG